MYVTKVLALIIFAIIWKTDGKNFSIWRHDATRFPRPESSGCVAIESSLVYICDPSNMLSKDKESVLHTKMRSLTLKGPCAHDVVLAAAFPGPLGNTSYLAKWSKILMTSWVVHHTNSTNIALGVVSGRNKKFAVNVDFSNIHTIGQKCTNAFGHIIFEFVKSAPISARHLEVEGEYKKDPSGETSYTVKAKLALPVYAIVIIVVVLLLAVIGAIALYFICLKK